MPKNFEDFNNRVDKFAKDMLEFAVENNKMPPNYNTATIFYLVEKIRVLEEKVGHLESRNGLYGIKK